MNNNEKESGENDKLTHEPLWEKPKVISKATFDEATGTLTLRLASDEEIAEDDRLLAMKNEQGAIKGSG